MSEQFPTKPGQVDPTVIPEELRQQQSAIRDMAEARVQDTPAPDWQARGTLQALGLEENDYEVFADSESPLGGGFIKILSKEDSADTLVGLSWVHVGGPTSDPNRTVKNYFLRPNGDIVGRVSTENSMGPNFTDISLAVDSPDPESVKKYQRSLSLMHEIAQQMIANSDGQERTPDSKEAPQAKRRRLGKLLGRSSLR